MKKLFCLIISALLLSSCGTPQAPSQGGTSTVPATSVAESLAKSENSSAVSTSSEAAGITVNFNPFDVTAVSDSMYTDSYEEGLSDYDLPEVKDVEAPVKIEELPFTFEVQEADVLGNIYVHSTYTNNSKINLTSFSLYYQLPSGAEMGFSSNESVLPGERSAIFNGPAEVGLTADNVTLITYETTDDNYTYYVEYDPKAKSYTAQQSSLTDYDAAPLDKVPVKVDEVAVELHYMEDPPGGNDHAYITVTNNSKYDIKWFNVQIKQPASNWEASVSTFDLIAPGATVEGTVVPLEPNMTPENYLYYAYTLDIDGVEYSINYDIKLDRYSVVSFDW